MFTNYELEAGNMIKRLIQLAKRPVFADGDRALAIRVWMSSCWIDGNVVQLQRLLYPNIVFFA